MFRVTATLNSIESVRAMLPAVIFWRASTTARSVSPGRFQKLTGVAFTVPPPPPLRIWALVSDFGWQVLRQAVVGLGPLLQFRPLKGAVFIDHPSEGGWMEAGRGRRRSSNGVSLPSEPPPVAVCAALPDREFELF